MGCNCKKADQINMILGDAPRKNEYEKKGVKFYLDMIWYAFLQLLFRLLGVVLMIVLTPIVMLVLIFKYIFRLHWGISFPKFLINKLKSL